MSKTKYDSFKMEIVFSHQILTISTSACISLTMKEAYLYFDSNKGCFIRSGKVTRQGFIVRGQEHFESSKKVTASLHFYEMYPSSTCMRALNPGIKRNF
jgi:hypothetical protein